MRSQLTEKARARLDEYVDDVRRSLRGRTDLDPDDVVAGIREHVDAELGGSAGYGPSRTPATAEDVADVLERLGAPAAWGEAAAAGEVATPAGVDATVSPASRRGAILPAFGLILLGGALAFTARWASLGWSLAVAGTLALRVAGLPDRVDASHAAVEVRLAGAWWWAAAGFGAVLLLLGPGALTWGAAQIGGVLEEPLASASGVAGTERTLRYCLATASAAVGVTGLWWIVVGLVLRTWGRIVRAALGPARALSGERAPRRLTAAGSSLVLLSLLLLLGLLL